MIFTFISNKNIDGNLYIQTDTISEVYKTEHKIQHCI